MDDRIVNIAVSLIYTVLGWALGHLSGWYYHHKAADEARAERLDVQRSYDDLKDQLRELGFIIQQGRVVARTGQDHGSSSASGTLTVTPGDLEG